MDIGKLIGHLITVGYILATAGLLVTATNGAKREAVKRAGTGLCL